MIFGQHSIAKCLVAIAAVCTCVVLGENKIFSNEFAVHIPSGREDADRIAAKHGFVNIGQIGSLKGYYLFEHKHVHKRSLSTNDHYHKTLMDEPKVGWVQQQHEKKRRKRDYQPTPASPFASLFGGVPAALHGQPRYRAAPSMAFTDPLYKEQWYLNGGAKDGFDMNVLPAWRKGYTGKGVVVSILDDGIQTNHPDLIQNYDSHASADINGNDDDPTPQDNGDNKHGTRCAGEVAATAYNQYCGVGVAFNASIGGVRMLDGSVNDAVEARALGLNPDHIDIYSASWGPEDDGKTVDGPGPLARRAFIYGVTSGRKGKGSIFVWASGNGGRHTDSCNCDGYTNSIFTLSISSATQGGHEPWYLEECSSTLATTYSSGTPGHDKSVATVDMDGKLRPDRICTVEHTGTSASAPLAAGICALALEANPNLTWRDMQYLVILTSRPEPLEKDSGWSVNAMKRKFSHKFGYGLMDAGAMVSLAEKWTTVPPQHICKSREITEEKAISTNSGEVLRLTLNDNGCRGTLNEVQHLEHVQCKITLRFFPRGNLRIHLTSPMGTTSTLLFERPRDVLNSNFDDWPFLSVHFWGEKPQGTWTLQIFNSGTRKTLKPGVLKKWQLIFYGTAKKPVVLKSRPAPQSQWRSPQNLFTFPGQEFQPSNADSDDFYAAGPLKAGFTNLQNIFNFAGSDPQKSVATLDGKLVSDVRENSLEDAVGDGKNCHPECDARGCFGNGSNKCNGCRNKKLDNSCVSSCPPRSYSDAHNVCQPCHESCDTCNGPGQANCLSCAPHHVRVLDLDLCMQQCPDGYYENFEDKTCTSCLANCVTCQDRPDYCTACDHHLVMFENKCYSSCPDSLYETDDYRCSPCHSSCATCRGPNSSDCVTCPKGSFEHQGQCLQECPAEFFGDTISSECRSCSHGCLACNSTTVCSACLDGWVLNARQSCVLNNSNKCDTAEYLNNGNCKPCHSTCETCNGPNEESCLSCTSPLLLQDTRCVATCENRFYLDKVTTMCSKCDHTCMMCSSRSNCSLCVSGLQLQNGECLVACSGGYYSDRGNCSKCYMSCETCSGPRNDQCVTCPEGWHLVKGQCYLHCPQGFYKTEYGCQKCHPYCRNCLDGCKTQADKRRITMDAYLDTPSPKQTIELINPLNLITVGAVLFCICVVALFISIFIILQRNSRDFAPRNYSKVSIKKPKVTCNYNIVAVNDDSSDTESSEAEHLIKSDARKGEC